tara:strand:- start:1473 stop:1850 length:378 start_codon:yes stop_codon:yes gene_type:complete
MEGIGPKLPLQRDSRFGNYDLIRSFGNEVKQNFKNLLLTAPGERMMNPDFGVGMRNFLFEPATRVSGLIRQRIDEQISKYMPFIKIIRVSINDGADGQVLSVVVEYNVPSLNIDSKIVINTQGNI